MFLEPPIFEKIATIHNVWNIGKLFIGVFAIVLCFIFEKNIKSPILVFALISLFYLPQIISTFENGGMIIRALQFYFSLVVIGLWFFTFTRYDNAIINVLFYYLALLVTVNLIVFFAFPEGVYVEYSMWGERLSYWILGMNNSFAPFVLLNEVIAAYLFLKKKKPIYLIAIIASILTSLFASSATMLVGVGVLSILIMLSFIFRKIIHNTFTNLFFIASFLLFFLIVVFSRQDMFAFFIENILGKNLTLTSRTIIWERSFAYIFQKPILGYGLLNTDDVRNMLSASHQHNFYLNILFQGGFLSLIVFLFLINRVRKGLTHSKGASYFVLSSGFFAFLIVFISEVYASSIAIPFYILMFLIIGISKKNNDSYVFFSHNSLL